MNKKQKKKLRELSELAWERELDKELDSLYKSFNDWGKNKIDCFELSQIIHLFHDGASREIWKKHSHLKPDMIVAMAVAAGILKKEEIPEEIYDEIEKKIELFK